MNKPIYILFLFIGFILANEPPVWGEIPVQNIDEDCGADICIGGAELFNLTEYISDIDTSLDEIVFEIGDI